MLAGVRQVGSAAMLVGPRPAWLRQPEIGDAVTERYRPPCSDPEIFFRASSMPAGPGPKPDLKGLFKVGGDAEAQLPDGESRRAADQVVGQPARVARPAKPGLNLLVRAPPERPAGRRVTGAELAGS